MEKKYLAKIIASDNEGLQMISACSAGAKVKVSDIKYLASNKVFVLPETGQCPQCANSRVNYPKRKPRNPITAGAREPARNIRTQTKRE